MSTKSTIFLTGMGEHCYEDCSKPLEKSNGEVVNAITIEFDKKNIRIDENDEWDLIITITNPDSEVYQIFESLKRKL